MKTCFSGKITDCKKVLNDGSNVSLNLKDL